jgi:hypothetical protein
MIKSVFKKREIMNLEIPKSKPQTSFHLLSPEAFACENAWQLKEIHRDKFNLGVWRRDFDADGFSEKSLERFPLLCESRVDLRNSKCLNLKPLFSHSAKKVLASIPQQIWMDWNALLGLFAQIVPARFARLRIEKVTTDSCRLFHTDYLGIRLLCTYAGPGTEWVPENYLNRAGLGQGENSNIVTDFSKVQKIATGDVVLLKGGRYPGNSKRGVVHRSPPIENSGKSRLLIRLDEEDASFSHLY